MFFNNRKKIAVALLGIWTLQSILPYASYALTSGPVQPEIASFQAANTTELVDLSTGDFKYNIPLMDIDGYPINLSYRSGVGMEDEASWVGLGWNLNIGAVNRQLRGIADDASGDEVKITHYTKPKVTIGGRFTGKAEVGGEDKKLGGGVSLSIGLFHDSYTGMGAEVGANAGISLSMLNEGRLTAGLGLGVLSNTANGVSTNISPFVNMELMEKSKEHNLSMASAGFNANLGYNSRSGMKGLTLGATYSGRIHQISGKGENIKDRGYANFSQGTSSTISFNEEPVYPTVQIPYKTSYTSVSIDVGAAAGIFFLGGGFSGYKSIKEVASQDISNQAYGFLYAERAKGNPNAVMDFIREKDNPVIPALPNLAIPVQLPDLFSYSSQVGGGQFRLFRSSGAFGDKESADRSVVNSFGADIGFGPATVHAGVNYFNQNAVTTTRRWTGTDNDFLNKADFQDNTYGLGKEHVYFKMVGEKSSENEQLNNLFYGQQAVQVGINGKKTLANFKGKAVTGAIQYSRRQARKTLVSYLTAEEAAKGGFRKKLWSYPMGKFFNLIYTSGPPLPNMIKSITRFDEQNTENYRKAHHISEITILENSGSRQVYGIPVYNTKQEEYSFALGNVDYENATKVKGNVVTYDLQGNGFSYKKGYDHYFHKESQPAYATSYLLSGIYSPDYYDTDGDERISDADYGNGLQFNYSKLDTLYKWRSPYGHQEATLNKGLLADRDDDKGSVVYGEKELWYVHSIESKTKIVCFYLEDRKDGFGVQDVHGEKGGVAQKLLKKISIYSKANPDRAIKTVVFNYDYSLCPGAPNSTASGQEGTGKLTLKSLWFEYGGTSKGKHNYYKFAYNAANPAYQLLSSDRWGSYKPANLQPAGFSASFPNDIFPYSVQDPEEAAELAGGWNLTRIVLPSGGIINIDYEADDYAYVQDRKAMEMRPITNLISAGGQITNDLRQAAGILMEVDDFYADQPSDILRWFKDTYLDKSDYLYTKLKVRMSTQFGGNPGDYDYIPVYAKVISVERQGSNHVKILFEKVNGYNPIIVAAWQKIKNEYPRFAYRGYSDGPDANTNPEKAIKAVLNAFKNLDELRANFNDRANTKGFAKDIAIDESFVRLVKTNGRKIGGGSRVKQVSITDDWAEMGSGEDAVYGQSYEYTTTEGGVQISSGVAANEPSIGGDENPLRQPIPYVQKITGASSNFFALEEPLGESFYPEASVAYSKVTVKDLKPGGIFGAVPETGSTVHEFYTARDFPVRVRTTPIDRVHHKPSFAYNFLSANIIDELCLSQGYAIELNDMHGKLKATRTLNSAGAEIASTVYHYATEPDGMSGYRLNNMVQVINPASGAVSEKVIGRETDFYTDMREQEASNRGLMLAAGVDILVIGIFPIPIPHVPSYNNDESKLFRSVCAVKVTQTYGMVKEIVKTDNGASIATENMAYDEQTGDPVVTRTQNEYGKYVYSVNMPAYWAYSGMSGAYQNQGLIIDGINESDGYVKNVYKSYLQEGDQLVSLSDGMDYWVIKKTVKEGCPIQYGDFRCLIDRQGNTVNSAITGKLKLIRSNFRNLLSAGTASYTCLENPVSGAGFAFKNSDVNSMKVLNAAVTTYHDQWGMPFVKDERILSFAEPGFEFAAPPYRNEYGQNEFYQYCHSTWINGTRCHYAGDYAYIKAALNRSSIWLKKESSVSNDATDFIASPGKEIGFITEITIPDHEGIPEITPDFYFLGFSGDDQLTVFIDGCVIGTTGTNAHKSWETVPVSLSPGKHTLMARATNTIGSNDFNTNPGAIGIEIYRNINEQDLLNADVNGNLPNGRYVKRVFSTRDLLDSLIMKSLQTFRTADNSSETIYRFADQFNPFTKGFLHNWHPYETMVFQKERTQNGVFASVNTGMDLGSSGYIEGVSSYWYNSNGQWLPNENGSWVRANTVTLYDKYGQEQENKDALGNYSAALFSFKGQIPAAVASNAKNREIYYESFEDNGSKSKLCSDTCKMIEFRNTVTNKTISEHVNNVFSHTGFYCATMPDNQSIVLTTKLSAATHQPGNYIFRNTAQDYRLLPHSNLYPKGFEPGRREYIVQAWVKDVASPYTKTSPIELRHNGLVVNPNTEAISIVEGWKRIEWKIDLKSAAIGSDFKIALKKTSGGQVYLDDLRIFPAKGNMKSYVYDYRNYRLMAELDENAMATFYEYDDQGSLSRVKKETERGIVMLKESRSGNKRKPPIN